MKHAGGEIAVCVLEPVPVAVIVHPAVAADVVENVALQLPAAAEKPVTVDGPDPAQPPPNVTLVNPEGAAPV